LRRYTNAIIAEKELEAKAIIAEKERELTELRAQTKSFSSEDLTEQYRSLDIIFTTSTKILEERKRLIDIHESEATRLAREEELKKWNVFMKRYVEQKVDDAEPPQRMSHSEICGTYSLVGHNPNTPEHTYTGTLQIEEENEVLLGTWTTGPRNRQHQHWGIGLLAGNTLAFAYVAPGLSATKHGIAIYEFKSAGVMRGRWSGPYGWEIGYEEARKIKEEEPNRKEEQSTPT
jgi:hypothetical protein